MSRACPACLRSPGRRHPLARPDASTTVRRYRSSRTTRARLLGRRLQLLPPRPDPSSPRPIATGVPRTPHHRERSISVSRRPSQRAEPPRRSVSPTIIRGLPVPMTPTPAQPHPRGEGPGVRPRPRLPKIPIGASARIVERGRSTPPTTGHGSRCRSNRTIRPTDCRGPICSCPSIRGQAQSPGQPAHQDHAPGPGTEATWGSSCSG